MPDQDAHTCRQSGSALVQTALPLASSDSLESHED
jgi:hypothetical protein